MCALWQAVVCCVRTVWLGHSCTVASTQVSGTLCALLFGRMTCSQAFSGISRYRNRRPKIRSSCRFFAAPAESKTNDSLHGPSTAQALSRARTAVRIKIVQGHRATVATVFGGMSIFARTDSLRGPIRHEYVSSVLRHTGFVVTSHHSIAQSACCICTSGRPANCRLHGI